MCLKFNRFEFVFNDWTDSAFLGDKDRLIQYLIVEDINVLLNTSVLQFITVISFICRKL